VSPPALAMLRTLFTCSRPATSVRAAPSPRDPRRVRLGTRARPARPTGLSSPALPGPTVAAVQGPAARVLPAAGVEVPSLPQQRAQVPVPQVSIRCRRASRALIRMRFPIALAADGAEAWRRRMTATCAGFYCPAGSTNATASVCPLGTWCDLGTGTPQPCAPGFTSGNQTGLTTAQCAGPCPGGYLCQGEPRRVLLMVVPTRCACRHQCPCSSQLGNSRQACLPADPLPRWGIHPSAVRQRDRVLPCGVKCPDPGDSRVLHGTCCGPRHQRN
jgi:hypothetical protein